MTGMSEDLVLADGAGAALPGVFSSVGLKLPKGLSFEEWERLGCGLRLLTRAKLWWWGDWLVHGELRYGDMHSQALEDNDYDYGSLRNAAYVAGRIELSRRHDRLSWSHHYEVAKFAPAEQDEWLDSAESEGWTSKELREAIRAAKGEPVELDSPLAIRQARDSLRGWYERYADRLSPPERVRLMNEIVIEVEREVSGRRGP